MPARLADNLLPYGDLLDERTILRDGGVQIRMWQIAGLPWELETNREINRLVGRLNAFWKNTANPALTASVHVCKVMEHDIPQAGEMRHTWPRQFDADYREHVLGDGLSRNVIYVSLAYQPGARIARQTSQWFGRKGRRPGAEDMRRMNEFSAMIERDLEGYGILPLGVRPERAFTGIEKWYSEVLEAIGVILYGRYERVPVPPPGSRAGRSVLRYRPIFVRGSQSFEVRIPGASRRARYHGAIFGASNWPEGTEPGILNELLSFPSGCVISAHFGFKGVSVARNLMKTRQTQAKNAGEEEEDDVTDIGKARKEHHKKEWVLGSMSLAVAVYAATLEELDHVAGEMNSRFLNAGFAPVQEDDNAEAAWASQAPGCWHKLARRDPYTSRNFAAVMPLHNYPYGDPDPLWGDYVADFKTTGGTLYRHNLHRDEVGSTLLLGMTGVGKSVLANLFLVGAVERLGARGVMFDVYEGSKPCILGMGGSYLSLRHGEPSGVAPLRAAHDTPQYLAHLVALFKACIRARAPRTFDFSAEEDARLPEALAIQLRMPPALRSWAAVRQVMGWRDKNGAGKWLEVWCEGGDLGWVFANEEDRVDLSRGCAGFDTTAILRDAEVCGPLLAHLSWRVRQLATGEPLFLFWDELAQALKVPAFEDIIGENLSTIRKLFGVVVMASQSPGALLESKIGDVITQQTPTKISFANKDGYWEEYERIGFTPIMFRMVTEDFVANPRQFVISRAGASVVCDFDLSPIKKHLWMLSGRASTGRELDRIIAEHGEDPEVWVPIFLERAPEAYARFRREEAERRAREKHAKERGLQLEAAE